MKKLNFIIATHSYDYASGGNNVLHNLAKILSFKSHNVFTFGPGNFGYQYKTLNIKNYDNNSRNWDDFNHNTPILNNLDKNKTFIIIPESFDESKIKLLEQYGNIVIWVLIHNTPDKFDFYNNKDRIYLYFNEGYNIFNFKQDGILHVPIIDSNYWSNHSNKKIEFNSVCYRKSLWYGQNQEWFLENIESLKNISENQLVNFDEHCPHFMFDPFSQIKRSSKKIFDKSEFFLSFDNSTFFSMAAAMSGCNSIIIPNPKSNLTPIEFRNKFPHYAKGIAYGFDDLNHMYETQKDVLPFMRDIEAKAKNNINNMIDICLSAI